jgi:hypothetical protein
MGELISEDQPRIKYSCTRTGAYALHSSHATKEVASLVELMGRMEQLGG